LARKFLTPVGLPSGASNPATGSAGDLFYNTSDGFIYNHNGTSWSQIVGDGMPAGGTTGQLLSKINGTDYNTEWVDETSIATSTVKHLVKNDSGVTLSKGTVVYTKSANGTNILVDKAIATNDTYSSQVLGFLESDLAANETGYCVNNGLVTNINTDGATAGDPVWLSGTTAGGFVTGAGNKPVAPTHLVYLGVVTRANSNTGEIFVHISNGWELDELHNVLIDGTPADNEVLAYDSGSSLWKNQTAAEANLSVVGHTHSIANVTSLQDSLDAKANLAGASFTGNISTTGDANVAGKLNITASSGNEGGELFLAAPAANTSITTGVNIDIYQNKLRFWEAGGTNRGYYVDITGGASAVGTSLTGGSTGAMNYAQTEGTKQSAISSVGTTIVSVSITTNGYPVLVNVTGDVENNSAGGWVVLQLYRGSTAIGNPVHAESSAGSENVPYALSVIDAPSAGTYTYALKLNNAAGGTFNFGESDGPVITAIELSGPKGDTGSAGANGTSPNAFTTISTPSGTNPVADSTSDTLTFTAGTGISITGDATADSIAIETNGASANGASTLVLRDSTGNFSANVVTASTFSGSGASLTAIPAANVTGTLTSTVLGNSTAYVGTTAIALNRASANQGLTGISSVTFPGSTSGTIQLLANAAAGTGTVLTLPATTGTLALTSQIPTVNDATLTLAVSGVGLSGSQTFTANQSTGATFTVTSNANSANGASTIVARDASGNFSANTVTATTFSGSGASLTNVPGANVTGTLTSTVLGNSTVYIGTTAVALNRSTGNLGLTGISSVTLPGSTSGTIQLLANATAGTGTVVTLPATTGTVVTTGDSGTVTNTMLAGSIANAKLANTAVSLGAQTLTLGAAATTTISGMTSVSSSTLTSTVATGTAPFTVTSTTQVTNLKAEFAGTADLANAVAVGNVSGLGANVATFLATPSSANLLNVMTTETGTGNLVFSTNPSLDGITLNAGTSFIIEDADSVVGRVIGSGNLFYIQAGADSNDSTGHIFMGRYANANPVANITLNATTTNVATNLRVGNDLTMVGSATLRTGASTAGDAPLYFASGTNLSAIEAGAVEYDGNVFYGTPKVTSTTYGRGLIPTTMVYSNNTSPTTTTSTGGATITLNPLGTAVTLPAGSFEVEGFVVVQVSSTVNPASTLRFGFTGTGVASMLFDEKYNANQATLTTIAAPTNGARTSVGTVSVVSSPTSGYYTRVWFKGIIRTSSTAAFNPIFTVVNGSTPATATLTAQPDGFMKVTPLNGTYTAAVNIGGWA
jgi:hypothetical protein